MDKKTLASLSKFILGIILIGSVLVLSGCDSIIKEIGEAFSRPSEREKVEIVLTERQKQILYDSGLSTDYDSLLQSQKSAIIAIEEMLQAVEKKYGMEFAYSGYTDATPLENETLWAYPKGGDPSTDSFSVQRSEKMVKLSILIII
ncbi:hypothetical protein [Clostridium polynesiense]|uniref:hypothetical protein n=1 Tax=Clostridium polynesiense TaxID=1325933 RepID=UPI00058EC71C|nr:hypothetical protein [Clostridium polynesiense]